MKLEKRVTYGGTYGLWNELRYIGEDHGRTRQSQCRSSGKYDFVLNHKDDWQTSNYLQYKLWLRRSALRSDSRTWCINILSIEWQRHFRVVVSMMDRTLGVRSSLRNWDFLWLKICIVWSHRRDLQIVTRLMDHR